MKEYSTGQIIMPRVFKRSNRAANILIVDDDVDSALLIETIFLRLGCETTCSLNSSEAKRKICAHKADVIILDWVLDDHIDAETVLSQCARVFDKFTKNGILHWRKPKIITYSTLDENEIGLFKSPYFDHLAHWQKPISQRELLMRSLNLLEKIGA